MTKFAVIEDPEALQEPEAEPVVEWWLRKDGKQRVEVVCRARGASSDPRGWLVATIGPSGITLWGNINESNDLGFPLDENGRVAVNDA